MDLRHFFLLLLAGGSVYVCIELLWRGRSHGSMFLCGGLCTVLIGMLNEWAPGLPLTAQMLLGACVITASELLFGFLFNRSYAVWDYRGCRTISAGRSARSISAAGSASRCWRSFWTTACGIWPSARRSGRIAYSNSPKTPSRQSSVMRTARISLCRSAACT